MRVTYIKARHDNYIWLIQNATRDCLIFCPGEAAPVLDWLQENNSQLAAILVTHHHGDHTQGIAELVAATQCAVFGPAAEAIPCNNNPLQAGDFFTPAPGFPRFQAIGCPGHTLGHLAYYAAPWLFVGDTLFSSGCGRMFEGTAQQFVQTLDTLSQLPADTEIYCAHEYTLANLAFAQVVEPENLAIKEKIRWAQQQRAENKATIPTLLSNELATNPFLRTHIAAVQQAAEKKAGKQIISKEEVFAVIRGWKDNF